MKTNVKKNILIAVLALLLIGAMAYIGIDVFGGEDTPEFGYAWLEQNFVTPLIASLGGGTVAAFVVRAIFNSITAKAKEASEKAASISETVSENSSTISEVAKNAIMVLAEFNKTNEIKLEAFTSIAKIMELGKGFAIKLIDYEIKRLEADITIANKDSLKNHLTALRELVADMTLDEAWQTINEITGEAENEEESYESETVLDSDE